MADLVSVRAGIVAVGEHATADLELILGDLDLADGYTVKAVLLEAFPDLVSTYGPGAGLLAADFYDEARAEAAVRGFYSAQVAPNPAVEQLASNVRYGIGPLFGETPDVALAVRLLTAAMDRDVQQVARDTIAESATNDPVRALWARVPGKKDPCAFCVVAAGRGAVFSERAAQKHYHTGCGCTAVPIWGEKDLSRLKRQTGYDPDGFEAKYRDARAAAGRTTLKGDSSDPDEQSILQVMREMYGLR
ncbi:hypothetical protein [Paenarthrobacter sp. YJN-5]|uniref:VG15 protein n=1 Tax=Paenarthrobacter sp. YJN-5 TaxID=2735316 RepID=UPI001878AB82|nr:hypothetical protein [Paenarthrobacter sp. YJN-5]QOT19724.1 hypothetical protein HMI59_23985 [Paenarthrobacter sp. YJN-5]